MAWLERLSITANVNDQNIKAIIPFDPDRVYWQLDLDGLDAVVGLAAIYQEEPCSSFFAYNIVEQLDRQRAKDLGSVAVYVERDESRNVEYGFAFVAEDTDFVPELPHL